LGCKIRFVQLQMLIWESQCAPFSALYEAVSSNKHSLKEREKMF